VPVLQVKGLTRRTKDQIVAEHAGDRFASLADFFLRVQPLPEEMDALIRAGAFDEFGASRTAQYWEFKSLCPIEGRAASGERRKAKAEGRGARGGEREVGCEGRGLRHPTRETRHSETARQLWLFPPGNLERLPSVPLSEPDRHQRLRWEEELLGYPVSDHPLALYPDIAWQTYCPINRLGRHVGQRIVTCGLVIEQRTFHQVTGELMKFITIADRTGIVETELFARTYRSYGLNTVRYRVLEITATVEPFENGRGYTLRVHQALKPRVAPCSEV
jgi:DNA polymerase III alpha subunit